MEQVNYINLSYRKDRLQSFAKECSEQGISNTKRWEGVIAEPTYKGISTVHKNIIRYAKENKMPMVCVAEDDVKFCDKGAWKYFIDNIPNDFDLYLAGVYCIDPILPDNRIKQFSGLILYICHERFYDKFLSANDSKQIDRAMADLHGRYIVCNPFAAIQHEGYSDNRGRIVLDYEKKYLKNRKLYVANAENNACTLESIH